MLLSDIQVLLDSTHIRLTPYSLAKLTVYLIIFCEIIYNFTELA